MSTDIYTALSAVMADVDHVSKRDRNEHQKFLFRGIDAVVNAVGPALRKHNVIVVPEVESADYADVKTSTGKPATACRLIVAYTFHAADGSSITTRVAGEAWDNGDKAAPKAMSVAFRTALLQALALPTDEPDPDHETFEKAPAGKRPAARKPTADTDKANSDTDKERRRMFALLNKRGIPDTEQLPGINKILGTEYTSRSDLTHDDMVQVNAFLEVQLAKMQGGAA